MIRKKKTVGIILGVLILLLFSIIVGYSALSTSLTTSNRSVLQNSMTWNIGFQQGTVNGVIVTNASNKVNCGTASVTTTSISGIHPTLSDTGDKCSYTFLILNQGNIAGKITEINITKPSGVTCTTSGSTMVCGDITYRLRYNSASSTSYVAVGDTIAAMSGSTPTSKTVVLTIEYSGTERATDDYNQSGFAYSLLFSQN